MPWKPPTKYDPAPDIPDRLIHGSPPVGSALFDMVVYWQWTHYWWHEKSIEEAWNDLRMSPSNAGKAIDQRIVRDFCPTLSDEPEANAALLTSPEGMPVAALLLGYNGPVEEGEKVLAPARRFGKPLADLVAPMPYGVRPVDA
jgi:hypothetical protein